MTLRFVFPMILSLMMGVGLLFAQGRIEEVTTREVTSALVTLFALSGAHQWLFREI